MATKTSATSVADLPARVGAPRAVPGSRRVVAVSTTVLLVTSAFVGLLIGAPVSAADESRTAPVRVGTYNIQLGRALPDYKAGVAGLKAHVDVAGLQEIAGRDRLSWLTQDPDWGVFLPATLRQLPVIWNRSELAFVSGEEQRLALGRQVEDTSGGFTYKKTTYAAVVRLRHRVTGRPISIVNVHLLSGATRSGLPRSESPLRHAYYVDQMSALRRLARDEAATGSRVMVTGDFNISYAADATIQRRRHPFRRFNSIGMTSVWHDRALAPHGTHIDHSCRPGVAECGAYIDGIWAQDRATSADVLTQLAHSDHYPAVATFQLPAAQEGS